MTVADETAAVGRKADRLQLRVDSRAKGRLQRAASYRRESVSQFVLRTALEEAETVIRDNERTTLSERDWQVFIDALDNPPAPNEALRAAFQAYRAGKADGSARE